MHIDRNCGINYKLGLTLGVRSCEGIGMSQKITPCGSVGNVVGGKREKYMRQSEGSKDEKGAFSIIKDKRASLLSLG